MWGNFGSSCLICKDSKDRDATWVGASQNFTQGNKDPRPEGTRKIRVCMRMAGKDLSPSDFTALLVVCCSTRMKWTDQKNQSVVRKMEMTRNSDLEHTIPPLVLIVILHYWDPCIDAFQGSISSESCSLPTLSGL